MKNLSQSVAIAVAILATTTSVALAKDHPLSSKNQRYDRNWQYWNQSDNGTNRAGTEHRRSDTAAASKASQYPCARCVYDQQLGGYVKKNYGLR